MMNDENNIRRMNRFMEMASEEKEVTRKPVRRKTWFLLIPVFVLSCFLVLLIMAYSSPVQELFLAFSGKPAPSASQSAVNLNTLNTDISQAEKSIVNLQRKLDRYVPRDAYLIINTTENEFVLRNSRDIIREGICSTGSYILLDAGEDQHWIFHTPRGMFKIQNKTTSPVWHKPDWAFIEDGLPIPAYDAPERYETGVLGDYALMLGHGYMLHGTLYKRLLGMPVTHGCVRLNDDDLEVIYKNLRIGSRVYIY
jgi:hypothetical protein